jgi:hypothetical protein
MARPDEPEAVRTTIVGGRPPGSGQNVGDVPRGVEILVKKAAVDAEFKTLLLEKRAAAAEAIALELDPAEEAMLAAVPRGQLEAIIANTKVSPALRPSFLGYAATVMLAALGAAAVGCNGGGPEPPVEGIRPDRPGETEERAEEGDDAEARADKGTLISRAGALPLLAWGGGARPDVPEAPEPPEAEEEDQDALQQKKHHKPDDYVTRGIKPDRP